MRPRFLLAAFVGIVLGVSMPRSVRADTILRLSETATVQAMPDELAGTVRAEATAPDAAAAQSAINAAMGAALARARQLPQVTFSTGTYEVWQTEPGQTGGQAGGRAQWHASQSLDLSSHDGPALLELVGALQRQGLAVGQLAWKLSRPVEEAARRQALAESLQRLRGRAEEAAKLLDLRFGSFREVRLEPAPTPVFPRAMMAAAAQTSASPNAEAGPVDVNATVAAEVLLLPH